MSVFHVTNGDSAAGGIREAGVPGEILAWRDVLHDGPVPGGVSFAQLRAIRARFIADCGWRSQDDALRDFTERDRALDRSLTCDEVVLWFEHDLYDQLQLLQLLDWFATCELGATTLSLICDAEYLGPSTAARIAERFPTRVPVTSEQIALAQHAWAAFRSSDPTDIERVIAGDTSALPFVRAALKRHLEQFPSTTNGLSRSESQALDAIANGATKLSDAFAASQQREDPIFLGDASFAMYVSALSNVTTPLLLTAGRDTFRANGARAMWDTELALTDAGHAVRSGKSDHVKLNGVDRWYGGVHLERVEAQWRWEGAKQRLAISD